MRLAIYTAIFGDKDCLLDDQLNIDGADYVAFTDKSIKSARWKVIVCNPPSSDNVRNAKVFKLFPHLFFHDYNTSLWIDGNMRIVRDFSQELQRLDQYPVLFRLPVPKHGKLCLYQEAKKCIELKKDSPRIINQQLDFYLKKGMPKDYGLWGCGGILRKHHDERIKQLSLLWWEQIVKFSCRDQISLPYVLWKMKLPVDAMNEREKLYLQKVQHIKTQNLLSKESMPNFSVIDFAKSIYEKVQ